MADFRLSGVLDFDTTTAINSIEKFTKKVESQGQALRTIGSDLQTFSGLIAQAGAAITGSIGAAFASASEEIPEVNEVLNSVKESFNSISVEIARAVLPTMQTLSGVIKGLSNVVKGFVERHGELLRQFLKYGAIAIGVSGLMFALGGLFRVVGLVITITTKLIAVFGAFQLVLSPITLSIAAVGLSLFAISKIFPQVGTAISGFSQSVKNSIFSLLGLDTLIGGVRKAIDDARSDFKKATEETTKLFSSFTSGFKSNLNSLKDNLKTFGASVSASLNSALSDTIFNSITGKVTNLKELLISFGNDIARAFSNFAANEVLALLFGDKSGSRGGLFGGLFGGGNSGAANKIKKLGNESDRTGDKFRALQRNMDLFADAKDRVINKFDKFTSGSDEGITGKPGSLGFGSPIAAGLSGALSGIGKIGDDTIESVENFTEKISVTQEMVNGVVQGFKNMQKETKKQVATYAVSSAAMVGISAVASAATVGIVGAAASALAAAWAPAAVLAAIATFGAAAVIGTGLTTAAVTSLPQLASATSQQGSQSFAGNISFGGGGGVEGFGAEGAIVNRPTVALIGEAGTEAVVPLNKTSGNSPLGGLGGSKTINMYIDHVDVNDPSDMPRFMARVKEELGR